MGKLYSFIESKKKEEEKQRALEEKQMRLLISIKLDEFLKSQMLKIKKGTYICFRKNLKDIIFKRCIKDNPNIDSRCIEDVVHDDSRIICAHNVYFIMNDMETSQDYIVEQLVDSMNEAVKKAISKGKAGFGLIHDIVSGNNLYVIELDEDFFNCEKVTFAKGVTDKLHMQFDDCICLACHKLGFTMLKYESHCELIIGISSKSLPQKLVDKLERIYGSLKKKILDYEIYKEERDSRHKKLIEYFVEGYIDKKLAENPGEECIELNVKTLESSLQILGFFKGENWGQYSSYLRNYLNANSRIVHKVLDIDHHPGAQYFSVEDHYIIYSLAEPIKEYKDYIINKLVEYFTTTIESIIRSSAINYMRHFDAKTQKYYLRLMFDENHYGAYHMLYLEGLAEKNNISFKDCLKIACEKLGLKLSEFYFKNSNSRGTYCFTIDEECEPSDRNEGD